MSDHARRTKRYRAHQGLALRCETWGDFVQFYATDISQGGLFIATETELKIMSVVEVRLDLPEGHQVPLKARIVHVVDKATAEAEGKEAGVGVEFMDLDDERKAHIHQLVDFARWEGSTGNSTFAAHMFERTATFQTLDEVVMSLPPQAPQAQPQDSAITQSGRPSHAAPQSGRPKRRRKRKRPPGDPRATGEFEKSEVAGGNSKRPKRKPPKPSDPVQLKEAMTHFAHRRYREAIVEFQKVDAGNPGDIEANKWMCIAEARLAAADKDDETAAKHYEKALDFDENNHEARRFVRDFHRSKKLEALPFGRLFVRRKSED